MVKLDFPKLRQTYEYDCGAKALQTILTYYGIEKSEAEIMKVAKTTKKYGTGINGITRSLTHYLLEYDSKKMSIKDLKSYIRNKIPVLLLIQAWSPKEVDYSTDYSHSHWVVAIGYGSKFIYFEDPYSFVTAKLSFDELEQRWHGKDINKKTLKHGIAIYGHKAEFSSNRIIHMD